MQAISTQPVDRSAAQDAIRNLYRVLNKVGPELLWFDAPLDAAVAAHILLIEQDPQFFERYWGQLVRKQRDEWTRVRAMISSQTGTIGWDETRRRLLPPPLNNTHGGRIGSAFLLRSLREQGHLPWLPVGPRYNHHLSSISDTSPATKEDRRREAQEYDRIQKLEEENDPVRLLQEDVDEIEWKCFYSSPTLEPAYKTEAMADTGIRFTDPEFTLSGVSFGQLARLEFLLKECGESFPDGYLAFLDVAKQVGLWWALERVAVVCDRPAELLRDASGRLHNANGPALVYRNGWKVFAVNGLISEPVLKAQQPRRRIKEAPILRAFLPDDPKERFEMLRESAGGGLPFYERYVAGERTEVWNELVEMGEQIPSIEHAADALAVAYATMDRAARNINLLVDRLNMLHYEFANPAWEKPSPDSRKEWREVDRRLGTIPLSLRAWWDLVGSVDFTGDHRLLSNRVNMSSPSLGTLLTDPLVVYGPATTLSEAEMFEGEPDYNPECVLAPDRYHKHEISGGAPYSICLPCVAADAIVQNEPNEVYFVDYLRQCFRYGGFPGFGDDESRIPQEEMAMLTEGLLEI